MWVWIDQFDAGTDIPLIFTDFSFEQLDVNSDVTPPTAEFESVTFDSNFTNQITIPVRFQDDVFLDSSYSGSLTLTGPNDYVPSYFASGVGATTTDELAFFGVRKANSIDYFDSSDNGVYTLSLNSNAVGDQAGNFIPGGVLGTIMVDIPDPVADTNPPVIDLVNANDVVSPPQGGRGSDIEFGIQVRDDRPFTNRRENIRVDGPNGYSRMGVDFAGGPAERTDELPYGFFDAIYIPLPGDGLWSSNENGTYTVSLDSDIVDAAGNVTPAQVLGTFVINLGSVEVG